MGGSARNSDAELWTHCRQLLSRSGGHARSGHRAAFSNTRHGRANSSTRRRRSSRGTAREHRRNGGVPSLPRKSSRTRNWLRLALLPSGLALGVCSNTVQKHRHECVPSLLKSLRRLATHSRLPGTLPRSWGGHSRRACAGQPRTPRRTTKQLWSTRTRAAGASASALLQLEGPTPGLL